MKLLDSYGFYVFLDPHQDTWSRFSGGSGAPLWTLYALGLNPKNFVDTNAAIIQNLSDDPENFPKMIWPTNYYKMACQVAFTLFFAGSDFAPDAIINGKNIEEYLQDSMLEAIRHFYKRIANETNLFNNSIFAVESINEPNPGLIGNHDLEIIPESQKLRKGPTPTAFQAMLLGSGLSCEVDVFEFSTLGPKKTGTCTVDPNGKSAWVQDNRYDLKYGFERGPNWKLGRCIWAQHGVWDDTTNTLLKKDYFGFDPNTGEPLSEESFIDKYWVRYWSKFFMGIREINKEIFLLAQPCAMGLPPKLKESAFMDGRVIYSPHFYDGLTLVQKHWSNLWNVDVVGVLRGKYSTPAFAIKIGKSAIRNCLRDQLKVIKQEGVQSLGNVPCLMSETGMPFDLDNKKAYDSGDFSSQRDALDALGFALEGAQLNHALWTYCSKNAHKFGDHWNGEDFSIYCRRDWEEVNEELSHIYAAPTLHSTPNEQMIDNGDADSNANADVKDETDTGEDIGISNLSFGEGSSASLSTRIAGNESSASLVSDSSEVTLMTRSRRQNWGAKPESSGSNSTNSSNDVSMNRAISAVARPYPVAVKGLIKEFGYDLQKYSFKLVLDADDCINSTDSSANERYSDTPTMDVDINGTVGTEIVIPDYSFPDTNFSVTPSSGTWSFDENTRILTWWHDQGNQSIEVVSQDSPRQRDFESSSASIYLGYDVDTWRNWFSSCFGYD